MTGNDTRFEYKLMRLKPAFVGGIDDDALQVALNDAGREGWELVQIVPAENLGMRLVFKRTR